jgi:ADP-ribose pyrophosphatase
VAREREVNYKDCRAITWKAFPNRQEFNMQVETLFEGKVFSVVRWRGTTPGGAAAEREFVVHPGAVVVVPVVDEGHVCLIRNFRGAVGQTLIELPAGTLEPGEPPAATAARELREETGYTAQSLDELAAFYMSPGILNERMHLFVATGLTAGDPDRQFNEEIENLVVTWEEALAMAADGRIQDAKSLVGLLMYDRLYR